MRVMIVDESTGRVLEYCRGWGRGCTDMYIGQRGKDAGGGEAPLRWGGEEGAVGVLRVV